MCRFSSIVVMGALATISAGVACAQQSAPPQLEASTSPLQIKHIRFTATPPPATAMEMTQPYTRSQAVVTLADGSERSFPLSYEILHRSGDFLSGGYAGLVVDKTGAPILESAATEDGRARGPFAAAGADGTSLLNVPGSKAAGVAGHTLFMVNHVEYATEATNVDPTKPPVELYGQLPMSMNLTTIDQDPATGALSPVALKTIDMASVQGLWIPCNSSISPWMTHLGSEEYEPDAQAFQQRPLDAMNLYLGTLGKTAAEGGANPYDYGHIVEVKVGGDGTTSVAKRFAMGRLAFEHGEVMPDRRTVYFGDDGDDVIRAMFVADKPEDLSAGVLYAARWVQSSAVDFGAARLEWIRLGHATDAEIRQLVASGIRFSDIWETAGADAAKAVPEGASESRPLYVYSGTGGATGLTYYRLKPGMEKAAAFLETRRYAAWRGATTEFTKMEGQAHNAADKKLYTAMSFIRKGMIDGQNASRPRDDIALSGDQKDLVCGAVYESAMSGGQKDTDGGLIDSDWVATDMKVLIHGARQPKNAKVGRYDKCDTERIANPDNIRYSDVMRTLFVGEDSNNHLNNFTWAVDIDTRMAVRIFSAPAGAENTGLGVYSDINGHAYVTGNLQHPGAAEDLKSYPDAIKRDLRALVDQRSIVGYLRGMPAMTR